MGFGWLFVGYFFANFVGSFSPLSFAMLVGYPMMLWGLRKLSTYHVRFRYCYYFCFLSLPLAAFYAVSGTAELLSATISWVAMLAPSFRWYFFVFTLCYHVLVLRAVAGISAELGFLLGQSAALRNLIFIGIYYAVAFVAMLPIPALNENGALLAVPTLLLRLICQFANLWLFYDCYRKIAPAEEALPIGKEEE